MRRTATLGLALAGAALLLAGCGGGGHSHAKPMNSGWFSYSPLPATAPASAPPVAHTELATGTRTAACREAIRDQYTPGTARLTGAPTTPPECAGLSSGEVSAVAQDVLEHQLG